MKMKMKTIAFNFKNITDLSEYDGSDTFTGLIDFKQIANINKNFTSGNEVYINTDINVENTKKFLKQWGVFYNKIINTGVLIK